MRFAYFYFMIMSFLSIKERTFFSNVMKYEAVLMIIKSHILISDSVYSTRPSTYQESGSAWSFSKKSKYGTGFFLKVGTGYLAG